MSGIFPNNGVPAVDAANSVDVPTQNCADGELFYSTTRCQPRFNPAAANAVMSELLNLVNCAGLAYDCQILDNICLAVRRMSRPVLGAGAPVLAPTTGSVWFVDTSTDPDTLYHYNTTTATWERLGTDVCAEAIPITEAQVNAGYDVPDDARFLLCDSGTLISLRSEDLLRAICASNQLPDISDVCGNILNLTLVDDGGCLKFATYSSASPATAQNNWAQIALHLPPSTGPYVIPDNFANPVDYYNTTTLLADDNLGLGVLNEARILNSRLGHSDFVNLCSRPYTLSITVGMANTPIVQDAFEQRASIYYRYRVNGGPWVYQRAGGQLIRFGFFNGLQTSVTSEVRIVIPAGNIEVETFYVANQIGAAFEPPVRIATSTFPIGSAGAATITTIRPTV